MGRKREPIKYTVHEHFLDASIEERGEAMNRMLRGWHRIEQESKKESD